MKIIITYSNQQLEDAVDFISKNNPSFLNQREYIRKCILSNMDYLAKNDSVSNIGTMGFLLTCDCEYEGIDQDENICRIEIHVDPSLGKDFENEDYGERVVEIT